MRYLAIHGHFYQPPRENPWTGEIEPEYTAHPYANWNERIAHECYQANAGNYARMSFDFAPTLLGWLEKQSPKIYQAILRADQESQTLFGEGSAVAMPYGHLILPLAQPRDRKTLILWGIKDFERRFRRKPKGMWLPETAVDLATLEDLTQAGISFTLLAPHQAASARPIGESNWKEFPSGSLPPQRAYQAALPSGKSLALFFFDGPISRGIAFEGLLKDGETLLSRLTGAFRAEDPSPQLVHAATDGETFGHHHRFGEMALAHVLSAAAKEGTVRLTNFASFLTRHPPAWEVKILENTSWSCAHGIERWRADCGCQVGSHRNWNQAWRAPLREALDGLKIKLDRCYEERATALFGDPWAARDRYTDILLDPSPLKESERALALKLLELQRCALLMFTSCGWFFDDLAGLETVLILRYAGRAVQLAQEVTGEPILSDFLSGLALAKSNRSRYLDGRVLFEKQVKPNFYRT